MLYKLGYAPAWWVTWPLCGLYLISSYIASSWSRSYNWRPSCKKGVYRILADFHFLPDRANFWQTDLFWHEKHRSIIVSVDLRFVLQKQRMQKNSAFLWRPFVQWKTKETFCFTKWMNEWMNECVSVISHTITGICYFCFVGASDWGAVRG